MPHVPNCADRHGVTEMERARIISKTLGHFTAARYLSLRGWSIEAATYILLGK